jgi:phosphoribosylglycinamide formyltransferase-1
MRRLGILISGRGSNLIAIAAAIADGRIAAAEIAIVISNHAAAGGLEWARQHGLPALAIPSRGVDREAYDRQVLDELRARKVDLVCLADTCA